MRNVDSGNLGHDSFEDSDAPRLTIDELIALLGSEISGEVVGSQTTYLDLIVSDIPIGSPGFYRIHFDHKYEFSIHRGPFRRLEVHDQHPLLLDYFQPIVRVQLVASIVDKSQFRDLMEQTASEVFGSWRSFEEYMWMPLDDFLSKDFGVLMETPLPFASALATKANADGEVLRLGESYYKLGPDWRSHKPRVMQLDDRFVLAERFSAVPRVEC